MRKYLFMVIILVLIPGLLGLSIHQYENRPKPKQGETLQQTIDHLAKAQRNLKEHDLINAIALRNADNRVATLTNQKDTLCIQIKANKLTQPLCP